MEAIPGATDHLDNILRAAMTEAVAQDADNASVASHGTSTGRAGRKSKASPPFTWTLPTGETLPLQRREVSIIDTQEKYTFTMGFFEEYRQQLQNHQGKDWVNVQVLNEWASKYDIPPLVEEEIRRENPGDSEETLRKKMLFALGEKLTKFFNNRAKAKVVKASAIATKASMEVSGRARSGRELFIDTIREDVLARAHAEFDKQKAAHEKGEGPVPEKVLNIMMGYSSEEWKALSPEERENWAEEAQVKRGQRQQI
ncbi:hypothetical protein BOTBODRAFT_181907 [Botryobasidium botryosum FD-172 SS1]|uniref:HMG box domain-containing protein n=1 Tax=Botryobasidium botryosum (strain FD-172 SS1) TaxID=930990 RepID=A0A067M2J4_BOTB1|nr:hypothetical protein BOTBODRAFT_181907 [Botryobasidium botryosum FD-172 SS1]